MNIDVAGTKSSNKSKQASFKDILKRNELDFEDHPAADLFRKSEKPSSPAPKRVEKKNDQIEEILKVIPNRFEKLEDSLNQSLKMNTLWRNIALGSIVLGLGILIFAPSKAVKTSPIKKVVATPLPTAPKKTVVKKSKNEIVAVRYINMRTQPSTSGSKILVVPPNQKLEVLKSQRDWKFVRYFDYAKKKTIKGWVYFTDTSFLPLKSN